jgi:hypothetical protein
MRRQPERCCSSFVVNCADPKCKAMLSIVQTQNASWCGLDMYENQCDYDTQQLL